MTSEQLKSFRLKAIQQGYSSQDVQDYLSSGDSFDDRKTLYEQKQNTLAQNQNTQSTNQKSQSRNVLQKAAGFLGVEKFGQGLAAVHNLNDSLNGVQSQADKSSEAATNQLQTILKKYPVGSKDRKRAIEAYTKSYSTGVSTAEDINPELKLSNKEVLGSAANVGLNVLTPGIFKGGAAAVIGKNAALGAGYGLAGGLNDNKSGVDLLKSGVVGGAIGAAIPVTGQLFSATTKKMLPRLSQKLEEANLRLTPVQKQNLGKKVDEVTTFLSEKKLVGSPESRFAKITQIYQNTENKLQNFLKDLPGGYKKEELIQHLEELKHNPVYLDSRDFDVIQKQIDGAIGLIQRNYSDVVPFARLNNLKRSTYESAYNKAGDKVLDNVEHDIGDIFRSVIEEGTKGKKIDGKNIADFNKEYGNIIQSRKLLKIAQSRNQLGLVGKLVSAFAGGVIGSSISPVAGAVIGGVVGPAIGSSVAGTAARSAIGAGLRNASKFGTGKTGKIINSGVRRALLNAN